MQVRLTSYSSSAVGVNVSVNGSFSLCALYDDELVSSPGLLTGIYSSPHEPVKDKQLQMRYGSLSYKFNLLALAYIHINKYIGIIYVFL